MQVIFKDVSGLMANVSFILCSNLFLTCCHFLCDDFNVGKNIWLKSSEPDMQYTKHLNFSIKREKNEAQGLIYKSWAQHRKDRMQMYTIQVSQLINQPINVNNHSTCFSSLFILVSTRINKTLLVVVVSLSSCVIFEWSHIIPELCGYNLEDWLINPDPEIETG